jgi:hypothetical protein
MAALKDLTESLSTAVGGRQFQSTMVRGKMMPFSVQYTDWRLASSRAQNVTFSMYNTIHWLTSGYFMNCTWERDISHVQFNTLIDVSLFHVQRTWHFSCTIQHTDWRLAILRVKNVTFLMYNTLIAVPRCFNIDN